MWLLMIALAPVPATPMTKAEAERVMDGWWGEYYGCPSCVKVGGVDPWEDGGKPHGEAGYFYVGYYEPGELTITGDRGGFSVRGGGRFHCFGRGKTIEDALYDSLRGGHGPMKAFGPRPDGTWAWQYDCERESAFLKTIGRPPIIRSR